MFHELQDYCKAIEWYTAAIEKEPSFLYYSNRIAAHYSLGDKESLESAITDADLCIDANPSWPKGYNRKGVALQAMGVSFLTLQVIILAILTILCIYIYTYRPTHKKAYVHTNRSCDVYKVVAIDIYIHFNIDG